MTILKEKMYDFRNLNFQFSLVWEEWKLDGHDLWCRRSRFLTNVLPRVTMFGFDPGEVNMGIAHLRKNGEGELWQVKFPSNCNSVQRIFNTESLMQAFFLQPRQEIGGTAVIENASFGSPYGQAALSENRTMIAHGLIERGVEVMFVPPLSIRKVVFGSAKIKAEEVWTELEYKHHNDVASALACALFGYLKEPLWANIS